MTYKNVEKWKLWWDYNAILYRNIFKSLYLKCVILDTLDQLWDAKPLPNIP